MDHTRHSPVWMRVAAPIIAGVIVIVIWQMVVSARLVSAGLLPAPARVMRRLGTDLVAGTLLPYALYTVWEALLGCFVASVVAIPLGFSIARSRLIEAAISPYLAASQAIPAIAIAPLLVLWIGYGMAPIVALCALLVFFPIVLSTALGLKAIDQDFIEAAQLDGASKFNLLRHIEAPLAQTAILTGLRNGFTLSITGAVVGEFVMGGKGLGTIVSIQSNSSDTVGLFATLLILAVLAMTVYLAMIVIEKTTDPLIDHSLTRKRS